MFTSSSHLPQLLAPDDYCSDTQYQAELRALLLPAWHCVGTLDDIPREGDFRTLDLLGHPVLIRRSEGKVFAYLNVCAHRFCILNDKPQGNLPKLRCQYHGWEYNCEGLTQKIPDAKSFRPLNKGEVGLVRFPVDTVGRLVFVRLSDEHVSLSEFLGPNHSVIDDWFGDCRRQMTSYDANVSCNWKTYLENGLESYHVDTVHAKTFVHWPDEAHCRHQLEDTWTSFTTEHEDPRRLYRALDTCVRRILKVPKEPYVHVHIYPSFTFIRMSVFTYVESVLPVAPGVTRVVTRGYCRQPADATAATRTASMLIGKWGARFLKIVQDEDLSILFPCQRGLRSSEHPRGGLVSIREERIHHFQRYVWKATGCASDGEKQLHESSSEYIRTS